MNKPVLHEIPKLAEISNLIENENDKGSYFVFTGNLNGSADDSRRG